MAAPDFYLEGTTPLRVDSEHRINQKILAAIRSQVGPGAVSDEDLIGLANLSGTGILTRVGVGDWRGRTLVAPGSGFFIDNPNGTSGDPTLRLDNTIGSPPYIKGILAALENAGSNGMAVLDQTTLPPFGPFLFNRTLAGTFGIGVTNGSGVSGNPTISLNINGMTEETAVDSADYLAVYDISASAHRKMTQAHFLAGITVTANAKAARISSSPSLTPGIPQNIHTVHTFDTEDFDTDAIATLASSTSRLTCKTAGKYVICGDVQWSSDNTGEYREIWIRKNGSTRIATQIIRAAQIVGPEQNIITVTDLAVNDYVEIMLFTNGTNSGLAAGNHLEMMAYG